MTESAHSRYLGTLEVEPGFPCPTFCAWLSCTAACHELHVAPALRTHDPLACRQVCLAGRHATTGT